jgi:hypothetical protein
MDYKNTDNLMINITYNSKRVTRKFPGIRAK